MNNQVDNDIDEELRKERWKAKIAEMKRQKEKREKLEKIIRSYGGYGVGVFVLAAIVSGMLLSQKSTNAKEPEESREMVAEEMTEVPENVEPMQPGEAENGIANTIKTGVESGQGGVLGTEESLVHISEEAEIMVGDVSFWGGYTAKTTEETINLGDSDVLSEYAVMIDASTGNIVAQKDAKTIINPASMTKVLTVLVAAEHVEDWDDTFTITLEMTDYSYVNDCSAAGFLDGETVTVRDLFYGTVLPSGGDAAVALATYVAGSHEAFVDMMNAKVEELGLAETAHFTNCVGLYDEEHYCTVYDMAIIMKAAMENDLCREVLSAKKYTTSVTEQHPEGILISNWFLRRIEDKDTGGEVLCAKTGYVVQSGNCAVSYGISETKKPYICVTGQTYSSWRCIYDHVALYSLYGK